MNTHQLTIENISTKIRQGVIADQLLDLQFGQCRIRLKTNSRQLVNRLAKYFEPFVDAKGDTDICVEALEMTAPELAIDFIDWKRDPGKVGRKDSYVDLIDGRICRKVRTGMQYLLSDKQSLIFGECLKNDNQVVNFIISLYITWLMHKGNILCHAAALSSKGKGFAIAAFSGGGKSTLALQLMRRGFDFISNDRTLIGFQEDVVIMSGVPKQPRINPGTVLNNPALVNVIPESRLAELATISEQDIWDLEEKYDADVESIFGAGKFKLSAVMRGFLVLNWNRNETQPTVFNRIDIRQRPDLLQAVMKSPGPFYMLPDNKVPSGVIEPVPDDYISIMSKLDIYEATGTVDFDKAVDFCVLNFA